MDITLDDAPIVFENAELEFEPDVGVFNIDLKIPKGVIFGLIGPSGCGKSTLLRMMLGLYEPTDGEVTVFGTKPSNFSNKERQRLGYVPQSFVLYPELSVRENLRFVASLYGINLMKWRRMFGDVLDVVELSDVKKRLARDLSGGMQRRLALAAGMLHKPDILLADEPTAGIDPVLRGGIWEHFRAIRDEGRTLVLSTQYIGEAAYCDVVAVMKDGRIVDIDTPAALRQKALGGEIVEVYVKPSEVHQAMRMLESHPQVLDVLRPRGSMDVIHVYVDDAAAVIPTLASLFEENNITLVSMEEHQTSFDDVFYQLMETETNYA